MTFGSIEMTVSGVRDDINFVIPTELSDKGSRDLSHTFEMTGGRGEITGGRGEMTGGRGEITDAPFEIPGDWRIQGAR